VSVLGIQEAILRASTQRGAITLALFASSVLAVCAGCGSDDGCNNSSMTGAVAATFNLSCSPNDLTSVVAHLLRRRDESPSSRRTTLGIRHISGPPARGSQAKSVKM
jgi:hypothetical protein